MGVGWGRCKHKIFAEKRKPAEAGADQKFRQKKEGWGRRYREIFDGRRKAGVDAMSKFPTEGGRLGQA